MSVFMAASAVRLLIRVAVMSPSLPSCFSEQGQGGSYNRIIFPVHIWETNSLLCLVSVPGLFR